MGGAGIAEPGVRAPRRGARYQRSRACYSGANEAVVAVDLDPRPRHLGRYGLLGFPKERTWLRVALLAASLLFTASRPAKCAPVTLSFSVVPTEAGPLARELWAEIIVPSGATRRLPAYHVDGRTYAVRTTAEQPGTYRLAAVSETVGATSRAFEPTPLNGGIVEIEAAQTSARPPVGIDGADPRRFALADGAPYVPIGTNLPWPDGDDVVGHYRQRFQQLHEAGLNWTRIWMCHWGGLNLDWLRDSELPSPRPGGSFDERVAERWDAILELAEKYGIYVQVVLQHHGQYSTQVNPNWDENPWNAANPGGFLATPAGFFTSERARELTRRKYRYIVARWGCSPAVLAWELFNEVHWVDAMRIEKKEAVVAAWHTEMAGWLRSIDPHHHLVTTSTDDVNSPIYARMDFLQPHLYARDMIAAIRAMQQPRHAPNRPVFFGEIGDDNTPLSEEEKKLGRGTMPPVWSALMGVGILPPQIWYGDRLIEGGRLHELGAVARFLAATDICQRPGLTPFSPAVESPARVPLRVRGAVDWEHVKPITVTVPTDGREPDGVGKVPSHFVSAAKRATSGYPDAVRFRVDYPRAAEATVRLGNCGPDGSEAVVLVDGKPIARRVWPPVEGETPAQPMDLALSLGPGPHTIEVRNARGPDWFEFVHLDTGLDTAAVGAVGKRAEDFIALWLWHRDQIHAANTGAGARGTVALDNVPSGRWTITWWDSIQGTMLSTDTRNHPGGELRLETPEIARHAAVVLSR